MTNTSGGGAVTHLPSVFSDDVPLLDRVYVVRFENGEYLRSVRRTEFQTARWQFEFANSLRAARRFTWVDLAERGPEALSAKEQDKSLWMNLVCAFGAGITLVRVK